MKRRSDKETTIKVHLNSHNKVRFDRIKDDFVHQTDKESQFYKKPRSKELVKFTHLYHPYLTNPSREIEHPDIDIFKKQVYIEKYKENPFQGLEKPELLNIISDLMVDQVFHCYTRQALPIIWEKLAKHVKWMVFFDIDDLHKLNEKFGYENVDRRITASLKMRQDGSTIVRWYSGDEFLVLGLSGDYKGFIRRIKKDFAEHGLSATFAGCLKKGSNYKKQINKLVEKVSKDKSERHPAL